MGWTSRINYSHLGYSVLYQELHSSTIFWYLWTIQVVTRCPNIWVWGTPPTPIHAFLIDVFLNILDWYVGFRIIYQYRYSIRKFRCESDTKDACIILLILNLNQEQGVISDRLVVRNVEQVCCYYISSNAFSKNMNNIVNMFPVERRCVITIIDVDSGECIFNVWVSFKDKKAFWLERASPIGWEDNMGKYLWIWWDKNIGCMKKGLTLGGICCMQTMGNNTTIFVVGVRTWATSVQTRAD